VSGKNIVYFDLETQRLLQDVGNAKHKLGISVAVTYSTARGTYEIYGENDLPRLADELVRADLVVGWNHQEFDYPVLQPHVLQTLNEQTVNLDMMLELQQVLGYRVGLDSAASATIGSGKSAHGIDAVIWWREYKKTGNFSHLRNIAEYCAYDVKVTRMVHEFTMRHGFIRFKDRDGKQVIESDVPWAKRPTMDESAGDAAPCAR